jgi:GTPase
MRKHCNKIPVRVKTEEDINSVIQNIQNGRICPVFTISNTTGESIDTLRNFIGRLPNRIRTPVHETNETEIKTKFIVDARHNSKGVGLILAGTVLKGTIKVNQELMFGPDKNGVFIPVVVKGIH